MIEACIPNMSKLVALNQIMAPIGWQHKKLKQMNAEHYSTANVLIHHPRVSAECLLGYCFVLQKWHSYGKKEYEYWSCALVARMEVSVMNIGPEYIN